MPIYRAECDRGFVLDRATGQRVPDIVWVDTDKGLAEQYVRDAWGLVMLDRRTNEAKRRLLRGSFLFIRDMSSYPQWQPLRPVVE